MKVIANTIYYYVNVWNSWNLGWKDRCVCIFENVVFSVYLQQVLLLRYFKKHTSFYIKLIHSSTGWSDNELCDLMIVNACFTVM